MVAEGVPGQLAGEPVILVEIVARVREDEVGLDVALSSSKTPSRPAEVRHEAVAEAV